MLYKFFMIAFYKINKELNKDSFYIRVLFYSQLRKALYICMYFKYNVIFLLFIIIVCMALFCIGLVLLRHARRGSD